MTRKTLKRKAARPEAELAANSGLVPTPTRKAGDRECPSTQ